MATGSDTSVIVPCRNEGEGLLRCLDALSRCEGAPELIVAAHGETPDLRARATACPRLSWIECPRPGRGIQMNLGAAAATGHGLLFVHADTALPADGVAQVEAALRQPGVVGGAFRLGFDARHPVLAALQLLSALPWRGAFLGDQAMFCRRDVFERVGGFWDRPLFEDVDLARRLAVHGRLVRLSGRVRTSARRFIAAGPWRQLGKNAALYARYRRGARVERLAETYER
jgi:rSAM/selenodomain-associated transferase 2